MRTISVRTTIERPQPSPTLSWKNDEDRLEEVDQRLERVGGEDGGQEWATV